MSKAEPEVKVMITARTVGDTANELEAARQGEQSAEVAANAGIEALKVARERREIAEENFARTASEFT